MTEKKLTKGNVALAEGAIQAGCRFYFGYPITPQNDIPEYLAKHLPKVGGTFIPAESEIASIKTRAARKQLKADPALRHTAALYDDSLDPAAFNYQITSREISAPA